MSKLLLFPSDVVPGEFTRPQFSPGAGGAAASFAEIFALEWSYGSDAQSGEGETNKFDDETASEPASAEPGLQQADLQYSGLEWDEAEVERSLAGRLAAAGSQPGRASIDGTERLHRIFEMAGLPFDGLELNVNRHTPGPEDEPDGEEAVEMEDSTGAGVEDPGFAASEPAIVTAAHAAKTQIVAAAQGASESGPAGDEDFAAPASRLARAAAPGPQPVEAETLRQSKPAMEAGQAVAEKAVRAGAGDGVQPAETYSTLTGSFAAARRPALAAVAAAADRQVEVVVSGADAGRPLAEIEYSRGDGEMPQGDGAIEADFPPPQLRAAGDGGAAVAREEPLLARYGAALFKPLLSFSAPRENPGPEVAVSADHPQLPLDRAAAGHAVTGAAAAGIEAAKEPAVAGAESLPGAAEQLADPIVEAGRHLWRSEARTLRLRLQPEELGQVEVEINRDAAGRLHAHLKVELEHTGRVLGDEIGQLRESLVRSGLEVGQLEVSTASHGSSGWRSDGQSGRPGRQQLARVTDHDFSEPVPEINGGEPRAGNRLLNLHA
jgi:hypothetical protein